jgi:hypothetical protein
MATDELDETRLLNALHTLADLSIDELDAEDQSRLLRVVETLETAQRARDARSAASADVTLVLELEKVYQRVLDAAAGKPHPSAPDTFSAVKNAAVDWVHARGKPDHDCLEQALLEELELDASEIEALQNRGAKATARHAAIVMADRIFDIPERTSYERQQKKNFTPLVTFDPVLDAEHEHRRRVHRIAAALEATTGLRRERAYQEAVRIAKAAVHEVLGDGGLPPP